jgi:hypothetical protein
MIVLVAAAGCVDLKSSYPERKYYTLSVERAGTVASPAKEGVLRVRRFTASKLSEGSELVTRTTEAVYESDFYNVFFVPPATQLTALTYYWLGVSGLFGTVVGTGSSVPETHVLEGNVIALYADRRQSTSAVIEVQFMLVRVASDPAAVMFQKNYRESVVVPEEGAEALVRGWNSGLGRILSALEADLAKADRSTKK